VFEKMASREGGKGGKMGKKKQNQVPAPLFRGRDLVIEKKKKNKQRRKGGR